MEIDIKLYKNFVECFNKLSKKYGTELQKLNGFGDSQLSYTDFIDNFVDKTKNVADTSIDGSANIAHKDVVSLEHEMHKPHLKLMAASKIFLSLTKRYSLKTAQEWLENEWNGHLYLHDFHSSTLVPYCYAYDLEKLVNEGLFFVENFNNQPPKHLNTYTDFVGEFTSWTCNRSSGAVGLVSFLIYSFWFWKKDCDEGYYIKSPEYYRDQNFQEIVYKLNQQYLRGGIQSAFTNMTIFDREYLTALFGGKEYPDGTYVIDYIDEIIEYQKCFMEEISRIRSQNMMTFPVLTFSLLKKDGKFADEDFAKWCCKHNMKWADSNFFISDDITSLSNCCFDGKQKVLIRTTKNAESISFEELYKTKTQKGDYKVFHNGSWLKGNIIKMPKRDLFKVTTANNKEIIVTDNHINLTEKGEKTTDKLTVNDYLLFSNLQLDTFPEKDDGLRYEDGFLIGMYLGDGSSDDEEIETHTPLTILSLNENKYLNNIEKIQKALDNLEINAEIKLRKQRNTYSVSISNCKLNEFIRKYISGKYSCEKELNINCLLQSAEFRKGILDGYYATDGGNSNRIYTTSAKLAEQIEILITSLGLQSTIETRDRTDEKVEIRGGEYNRNYPTICIRWYAPKNKRSNTGVFIIRNNSIYFKIKSIEKYETDDDFVYCFEMPVHEPYFTLPNGIITHNCRLISDVNQLGYFNSIGGTALEVGSVKVNTINLARLSYENTTEESYLESLRYQTELCLKTLDCIRHIISRNIEKGLLPNYTLEVMHLESQYNTIGIIGIYETLQKFGYTYTDQFGYTYYSEKGIEFAKRILKVIQEVKTDFVKDRNYMISVEQIPGESSASTLMLKDMIFYPNEAYELPLYGNQWIPLGVKTTLNEKIRLSAILDKACSGGSIAHINISSPFQSFDTAWELLNYISDQGVTYFAFNLKISSCKNNHGYFGDVCPHCGNPTVTTYQRIVGFITPEKTYSKARKSEFKLRDWIDVG